MSRNLFRQVFATGMLVLAASGLQAQLFQELYYSNQPQATVGGIYKDVQCLETVPQTGEAIVAVGSDNQIPTRGVLAYHNQNGNILRYLEVKQDQGHPLNAMAICATSANNLVATFFDPVDQASEVISTDPTGVVIFRNRLPNFMVRDLVSGTDPQTGGVKVWLTGNSTGGTPHVKAAQLDGVTGNADWVNEYQINNNNYFNTVGFEIDVLPGNSRLTIVGKTSIQACPEGVLVLRLQPNGAVIWSKVYNSADCSYAMLGKALVKRPGLGTNYGLAVEYKDLTGPAGSFPGVISIDFAGNVTAAKFNNGPAPFDGASFTVDGLDTDGTDYMISGTFHNTNFAGAIWGYTLNTTVAGAGLQFNEYAASSAYPSFENKFEDIDYYAALNTYVVGGHFRHNGAPVWPASPIDVAYWMVQTDPAGGSVCPTSADPTSVDFAPSPTAVNYNVVARDDAAYTISVDDQPKNQFPECNLNKTGMNESIENLLPTNAASFAYLEGQGKILARVPADVKGNLNLSIVDIQGRVLAQFSLAAGEQKIDASALRPGVYMLRYEANGIQSGVQKIAVR